MHWARSLHPEDKDRVVAQELDGKGYPRGLAGEEIPLGGRIAAVADIFDARTTDRVYRPAYSDDRAFLTIL